MLWRDADAKFDDPALSPTRNGYCTEAPKRYTSYVSLI